jgi:hypothetical protein
MTAHFPILAIALLILTAAFSCAGPERKPAAEPGPSDRVLALPTQWYCPWCSSESPDSPWSPSPPGTGQMVHRSPRYFDGMQFNVPREYPLHWSEGITAPRPGPGPMTRADARRLLSRWAADHPRMTVGKIEDKEEVFEGTILEQGKVAGRFQVDKATGWFRQVE